MTPQLQLIPVEREEEAKRLYREGAAPAEIHRFLWPEGKPAVSYSTLAQVMRSLVEAEDEEPPSDELPAFLDTAMANLETAQELLMDQMRSGGTLEEPGVNPLLFDKLAKIVRELVGLSKHKMELQEHRLKFKTPKRH